MKVKIINKSGYPNPQYATPQSAGCDLVASIPTYFNLRPFERTIIPTGIYLQLPVGYEAQVRPRSGLAIKHGITVLNAPGTVDADFIGEVGVILINLSNDPYTISPGERIAQLVVAKHEQAEWEDVEVLDATERGNGGFGHSGK